MKKNENVKQSEFHGFGRPMLLGAGVALAVIMLFVVPTHPKPEWNKLWMLRPLIITPLAGAMGGLGYYLVNYLAGRFGIHKAIAVGVGLFGFLVTLWLGIILGLDGTLWD